MLSRGEQIMARFYMSVWRGENHDFNFLDAAAPLSSDGKKLFLPGLPIRSGRNSEDTSAAFTNRLRLCLIGDKSPKIPH